VSETVRNYSGSGGQVRPGKWKSRGGCLRQSIILTVILLAALWWITRDTDDVAAFMPAGLRYNVVVADPVNGRERMVSSAVWNAWPDIASRERLLQHFRQDPGLPQWVMNNLVTERLYLFGDDVRAFSDVLAITRMSRIGALLEKFHSLSGSVTNDYAGGLRLRHAADDGVYYAVRGRVLLISPDRDALIRSLTLRQGAAIDEMTQEELERPGAEDFRGTVQLAADDPLGDSFESIAFAVRIDDDQAYAKCHAVIRDTARPRFGPLLNGTKPYPLEVPLPGAIELSANFGKPVREVWASLGEALESAWLNAAQWQKWEAGADDGAPTNAQFVTGLTGPLGPGIRLSCTGIDLNEMAPMPILVGAVQNPPGGLPALDTLPPPPPGAKPWDSYPRYDAEKKLAHIPLIGGGSLHPAAALTGRHLIVSTNFDAAETAASSVPSGTLPEEGNVYIRVQPKPVIEGLTGALRQFAEVGMLRGYTLESFDAAAETWTASASRVHELVVIASGVADSIDAELRVHCAPR